MIIDTNIKSIHNSKLSIKNLIQQQLTFLRPTQNIIQLFEKRTHYLEDILYIILYLEDTICYPIIDDIVNATALLKTGLDALSIQLKREHEITKKSIYLHNVHNIYGIILLEFNELIIITELHLRNDKLSNGTFEQIMNDNNTRPIKIKPQTNNSWCKIS